jgi:hypothetical protein
VIDTTNGCDYEFQGFTPETMSAHSEATYHADTGSGGHVSDQGHAGGELSYLGGLITPDDVRAGVITHALRFAIPDNTWTFNYPGTRSDGTITAGVPEGTRIQLDPNLNLNSLICRRFSAWSPGRCKLTALTTGTRRAHSRSSRRARLTDRRITNPLRRCLNR